MDIGSVVMFRDELKAEGALARPYVIVGYGEEFGWGPSGSPMFHVVDLLNDSAGWRGASRFDLAEMDPDRRVRYLIKQAEAAFDERDFDRSRALLVVANAILDFMAS